ncbi:MAG: sulfurtransferase [Planctomycetes bacterium]|nr:sulfurtransferase [Planctomycetota bacterium]
MAPTHSAGFLAVVSEAKQHIRECTIHDLKSRLDRGERLHLIDVREDHEWAVDRVQGATHLGRGVLERDIEAKIPDHAAPIVLYCGGGFRSALAAWNLGKMGYTNVLSMDGGIRAWREAGYPLDKP